MKIRAIEYQNFRNFEKRGKIFFDTDGKITIVYGTNGDGKTTLHQLFQWILYGRVNFNRTTSGNKLYNLDAGEKLNIGCFFKTYGKIEFEHNGEEYTVCREWCYYKQNNGNIARKTENDDFSVLKCDEKKDWRQLENPNLIIDEVLPVGLSSYFFFDGETMIADLKMTGSESARSLKKALFSILELELYEYALRDLGTTTQSQTVIGILHNKMLSARAKSTTEKKSREILKDIKILKRKIEEIESGVAEKKRRMKENSERITELSEIIGSGKSNRKLENLRRELKKSIEVHETTIKEEQKHFGDEAANNFAYLLVAKVANEAGERLYLEVQEEEKNVIPGLTKELLVNLLKEETCLCGNPLCDKEHLSLERWKSFFPPASYKATYDKFESSMRKYSGRYSNDRLLEYFKRIVKLKATIRDINVQIQEYDQEIKNNGDVDLYIDERNRLEKENTRLSAEIEQDQRNQGDFESRLRVREKRSESISDANDEVEMYKKQCEYMLKVVEAIKDELKKETEEYTHRLEAEIRILVETMLTSEREVVLNDDFQLKVRDSHGDESKSEGQFAVISFAYIGGILKVLSSFDKFREKEYPLILDGPFSKLDSQQKANILTTIPEYVPQVIIFSKDSLFGDIEEEKIGKVWTIQSNAEKNNAVIREGYWW